MSTIIRLIKVNPNDKGAFIVGKDVIYANNLVIAYKISAKWVLDLSKREKLSPESLETFDLLAELLETVESFEKGKKMCAYLLKKKCQTNNILSICDYLFIVDNRQLFAGVELVAELIQGRWQFNANEANIKDVIMLHKLKQFKSLMQF
jgi:hypothetical protein